MVKTRDRFLLASEAARMLDLSPQRVRQLVDGGRLAARRGPRGIRLIERKALEALVERRREAAVNRPRPQLLIDPAKMVLAARKGRRKDI
jgi:helix-turn-helix protein